MPVSTIKATIYGKAADVFKTVTSLENYKWRSDLSKIEVIDEKRFVEYTKDGYATEFTITVLKPFERYEFDMENDNMKGHWTGVFRTVNGHTEIEFTENVSSKKLLMKPFVKLYLKKQQAIYIKDLKKAQAEVKDKS